MTILIPNFVKKPIFIIAIVVSAAILIGYFYFFRGKEKESDFFVVKKGDILQEVSVTGRVNSTRSADLAFEKSGKIISIFAKVGDFVYSGDVLAREDNSELSAQLLKAQADLVAKKADLDKSRVVLANYYSGIIDILNDAHIKADDAVKKQAGAMFTDAESDTPRLSFSSANSQAVTDSQNGRLISRAELSAWREELGKLGAVSSDDGLFSALIKSKAHLSIISSFLISVADALEKATGLSQSTLDSYKAGITTGRTNINTALTNITDRNQNINSQKAAIVSEEAAVKSYEASVQNIEAQITKTILRSPIAGVVAKQDAKIGEIAAANAVLISIISTQYEIEANIPEADIAKIKVGDSAKVTLDAYGSDVIFNAKVKSVEPAEKIIEGVSTYKTILEFVSNEKQVKPGMTANIDILSAKKENALIIPQRAVISKNGEKYVILINNNREEVKVNVGLRGSDGNIEIIDGIKEGDHVSY